MAVLLDKYSLDTAEDLLSIPKTKLLRYAQEGHLSLAIYIHDLGCQKFKSLYGDSFYGLDHFERIGYINSNLVDAYYSSLLDGEINIAAIQNFTKYPVGHAEYGLGNEIYVPHFDSEKYKWWLYEQNHVAEVFLTQNSVLSSPITQGFFSGHNIGKGKNDNPVVVRDGFLPEEPVQNEPHKYQVWQDAVNAAHQKRPSLKHTDISKLVGKEFSVEPETIRRHTKKPRK